MSDSKQPVARVAPVVDDLFGVAAVDPYRWMEDDGPELDEWLAGQAAYADETSRRCRIGPRWSTGSPT
jgi:protease II